jgi:hypothetical protein
VEQIKNLLNILPKNIVMLILESSLLAHLKNTRNNKTFRDIILGIYENYYGNFSDKDDGIFYIISYDNKFRCLKNIEEGWKDCSDKDIKFYKEIKNAKEKVMIKQSTNPYGYYGKYNGDNFCIAEVDDIAQKAYGEKGDKRKLKSGTKCNTGEFQKEGLLKLVINKIRIPIPSDAVIKNDKKDKITFIAESRYFNILFTEEERQNIMNKSIGNDEINRIYFWMKQTGPVICKLLREFFQKNNLIKEDPDCGVQNKSSKAKYVLVEGGAEESKK